MFFFCFFIIFSVCWVGFDCGGKVVRFEESVLGK